METEADAQQRVAIVGCVEDVDLAVDVDVGRIDATRSKWDLL